MKNFTVDNNELDISIKLFAEKDYFGAYKVLFEQLCKKEDTTNVEFYLALFSYATGCKDLTNFYLDKLGYNSFVDFITQIQSLEMKEILFTDEIHHIWDNYRRDRNINELNRFGVTSPLCKGDVLEIGCANGDLSSHIAMNADRLFGIDIDPIAIELARYKVNQFGLNNCYFNLGDGSNLIYEDNSFDTVVLAEVLEHVPDPSPFIKEAYRVCKPSGKILISVPRGYSIPDPDHVRIFTKSKLTALINEHITEEIDWNENVPNQWLLCTIEKSISQAKVNDGQEDKKVDLFLPQHPLSDLDNTEKVTVIIPTFNRANYLNESLKSVLNQTYTNIEVIVVDDGSTDETNEILSSYAQSIIHLKKENGGKSSAINLGLTKAQGKYVWVFDDDDIALPKKLELQVRQFQKNRNIGLSHTSAILMNTDKNEDSFVGLMQRTLSKEKAIREQMRGNHFFSPSVVVLRECFNKVGEWDETLVRAQDYDMWTRISQYYQVEALSVPTIHYRMHSGVRGTKKDAIDTQNLQLRTQEFDKIILRKVHNLPIETIFDIKGNENNTSFIVECYLERALYLSKLDMVDECVQDIIQAKEIAAESELLNFSFNGLNLIINLDKIIQQWMDPRATINMLYFLKMIKKGNSN